MLGCLKFTRIQELSPCLTWWRSASQPISIFFCQKYLKFDLKRFWQKCPPYSSSVSQFTNIRHHLMTDMNYQAPPDCWVIIFFLSKFLPTISTFLKILHSLKSTVFHSERIPGEQFFIIYRSSWNNLVNCQVNTFKLIDCNLAHHDREIVQWVDYYQQRNYFGGLIGPFYAIPNPFLTFSSLRRI